MKDNLDKKRQYFKDSVYLKYENKKNEISEDIDIDKHFKKKNNKFKIISKVAVALLVCTLGMGVYAGVAGRLDLEKIGFLRLSEKYEESSVIIDKATENDYCKIVLESMAGDNSYLVVEYRIILKEEALQKFGEISYDEAVGYGLYLNNDVYIDGEKNDHIMSSIDKISDTEYSYIEVINVMNVENEVSVLGLDLNSLVWRTTGDFISIDKTISASINLKKEAKSEMIMQELKIDDNNKMVVQEVANTKFETFIKLRKVTTDVTWEEYNENPFEYSSFILTNEQGEQIGATVRSGVWTGTKFYIKENEEYKEVDIRENVIKDNDIVKVEEDFIILVGAEEGEKINLTLARSRMYNDRTDEESKMYELATWYPVKAGEEKSSAKSGLGGTFEVERIVVDNENIIFYYNESGVLGDEWRVIIRDNNGKMNYIHPIKQEKENVNSKENKITFSRNTAYAAGLNLHTIDMENIDNLEFTLLFGCVTETLGESIEISIPKLNEETAKITDIIF